MDLYTQLKHDKYLLLENNLSPISKSSFLLLNQLVDKVPYERISSGDSLSDDGHNLFVGRYRRDKKYPTDLHATSHDLMSIINNDIMQSFYKEITHFKRTCIRRAQANILKQGGYIGLHVDGEGSSDFKTGHKDYKYAVVLHFENDYSGGDTIIYKDNKIIRVKLPAYSFFVLSCDLPHEIDTVISGTRKTIAYFLSDNFGLSKE